MSETNRENAQAATYVAEHFSSVLAQSNEPNEIFKRSSFVAGIVLICTLLAAWISMLSVVTMGHEKIAIGKELMQACEYSYMERDTPRWKLAKYFTDKVQLVNVSAQMCGIAYVACIVISIFVVGWLSWKTTLEGGLGSRKIIYVLGALAFTMWLVKGVLSQKQDGATQLFFQLPSPTLPKTTRVRVAPIVTHLSSAIVSGIAFAIMWMLSGGGPSVYVFLLGQVPFVAYMFILWGISAGLLGLTSFQGASAYNDVIVGYNALKRLFANVILTKKQKDALFAIYKRNHLLVNGSSAELKLNMDAVLEYMTHDKGAEFPEIEMVSTTADERRNLKNLRDVMSKLRRHDSSAVRMSRWFHWMAIMTLGVVGIIMWPLFVQFRRFDNMQLGGEGTLWLFITFFTLLVSAIIIVWVLSMLMSLGVSSDG